LLLLEDSLQLLVQVAVPGFAVLRLAGLQADDAVLEVHPIPRQVQDLGPSPPGLIREGHKALEVVGQGVSQGQEVTVLEEALADVFLLEHLDVGRPIDLRGDG
jgi:hypothetical protein